MFLGWSSRTYPLDAADLVRLPDCDDAAIRERDLPDDAVILLVRRGSPDALVRGRGAVAAAGNGTVDVRVVFAPSVAKWNLPFTLVRVLRNRRRFKSSGVYHIATDAIRQMGLERAVRTLEAPQMRGDESRRRARMSKLEKSLRERGYDDSRPINVMLCRSRGVHDSLRQGHHRISACVECGVPKMAIRFSAAGALPRSLARFAGGASVRMDVLRNSLESRIDAPLARLVPVEGERGRCDFIVVPESGRRFVVTLVRDGTIARVGLPAGRKGPLALAAGVAPAVLVPLLVGGAVALDVAVMKTACGERSLVAWSQFASAGLSAAVFAALAALERRARSGYAFAAYMFLSMSLYELIHDVEAVHSKWIGNVAVAATLAVAAALLAFSRRTLATGLRRIVASRGFLALPFGLASIWGVSKLVSMRAVWGALGLSAEELKAVKRVAEEGTELLGYVSIFCWAVFFLFERMAVWRRARR